MSGMTWTQGQQNAISARNGSILVSAAAGSGKTAVLVQRVIETITSKENPVPIDRMLIVTFTRAAREEMLTRVEKAINKLLAEDPYNKHLLMQRQLLYNARITTIDGFCTDFVRQYFYKLDIQQDFRIADEKELELLKNQALDNTLEFFYNSNSQEFFNLVDAICTYRNDNRLRDNILKLYRFLVTIPFMDSWMDERLRSYDINSTPVQKSPFIIYIIKNMESCLLYCSELLKNAAQLLDKDELLTEKVKTKLYDVLHQDEILINDLFEEARAENWDGLRISLLSLKWKTYPRDKDESGVKERIKSIRDNYKAEIKAAGGLLSDSIEDISADTVKLYPLIQTLFDCVKEFTEEFTGLKAERNLLDFSDIENNMIKLLCKKTDSGIIYTDTAKEISSMFDYIMVDEFQDINEVQNLIFKAVSQNEDNLFMVGDVKQSIYGFRQANPEIFISYKEKYKTYDKSLDNYPAKIILDKNFRSRDSVLNTCNFVFEKLMSPDVGGITYNQEEVLNCGANYTPNNQAQTELILIDTSAAGEDNDDTKTIIEARNVARKINHILYNEKYMVQGKDGLRSAQPGDIAILLRTSKGAGQKAAIYVETLAQEGIIAVASEKKSIFDSIEIKILLNLLRVIDNPMQDIPLLSVLISPLFGFTPDDLAEIRINYPYDPLYSALLKSKMNFEKCNCFINTLSDLRAISVTTSVGELIVIIMQMTGFDSIMTALHGEPAKNILLLQKYAREYGDNGYVGLTSFISFINNVIDKGLTLDGSVSNDSEIINAVKVMSIHASKGLEFPICFICDTNTQFNTIDTKEDMVIDSKNGVGIRYKTDYLKYDSIQRRAASLMLKNSFISEELRILYVAMTRAKERLILTAGNNDPAKYLCSVASKLTGGNISSYTVRNFRSFSDWIVACALVHPSGDVWRKRAGCSFDIPENAGLFPWDLSIVNDDNEEEIEVDTDNTSVETEPANKDFLDVFTSRVNHKYPYDLFETLPQKVSASDLSHKDSGFFDMVLRKPAFVTDEKVSATDRGTAIHKFLEFCDFESARQDLEFEVERLRSCGYLTKIQCDILDVDKIRNFINSSLISRVLNSQEYHREFKFTVKINCNDYDSRIPHDFAQNKIVMQGAVDMVFIEDGQAVIVDYKTDRVNDINSLKDLYFKQLQLYKSAIEQSMEVPVKEVCIYSLHLNEKLNINF